MLVGYIHSHGDYVKPSDLRFSKGSRPGDGYDGQLMAGPGNDLDFYLANAAGELWVKRERTIPHLDPMRLAWGFYHDRVMETNKVPEYLRITRPNKPI